MTASLFGVGGLINVNVNGSLVPQSFIGTAAQTLFLITNFVYTPGTNSLLVFVNGTRQILGRDFIETSTTSFTLVEGVVAGDFVDVIGFPQVNLTAVTAGSTTYLQPYTGSQSRTQLDKDIELVSVLDFCSIAQIADIRAYGFTQDITAVVAGMLANLPASGAYIYFPPGGYLCSISVRRNNVAIVGAGEPVTFIKHPPGALAPGGVMEFGNTALGNGAPPYSNFICVGIDFDQNKANTSAPTDDLRGHGIILTNCSKYYIAGVNVRNAWNGGVVPVITSNYGYIQAYIEACGSAAFGNPGFDINSSSHIVFNIVTNGCYAGGRAIDNCWGTSGYINILNPQTHGWIHQNQTVNASYANQHNVTVKGAGGHGLIIGENVTGYTLTADVTDSALCGAVLNDASVPANRPQGQFNITTRRSGSQGLLSYALQSDIKYTSLNDGLTGAPGSSFALDINGNLSTYNAVINGNAQARGTAIRAGATDNQIATLVEANVVSTFQDAGTRTLRPKYRGAVQSIASAANITISALGDFFNITGATATTSITADQAGRRITLIAPGGWTLTNGSNLKLSANWTGAAGTSMSLFSDGVNWREDGGRF